MKKCNIIAFAGRARNGKSYCSQIIQQEYNGHLVVIANFLKKLCCNILSINIDELNQFKNSNKEINFHFKDSDIFFLSKECNIDINILYNELHEKKINSVRQMLQFLGTDIIRKYNPSWHIDKMNIVIKNYINANKLVVIDDVRFPNEKKAIEDNNGEVFFITRPFIDNVSNHISETSLNIDNFDDNKIIFNYYDKEYIHNVIEDIMNGNYHSPSCYNRYNNINENIYRYIASCDKNIVKLNNRICLEVNNCDIVQLCNSLNKNQYILNNKKIYIIDPYIIERIKIYL